ncbi:MAG: serine hydrolase [Pseudomonadota bacterium]
MTAGGRVLRIGLISLTILLLSGLAGFLWLRTTPYWAGVTLFSEGKRVENFRNMQDVFPYRDVPRDGDVWAFASDPQPLPETYIFDGETKDLNVFLSETVTTGLLVVHDGAITYEDYRLGADDTARFTSWSVAKSILSALIGIALEDGHIASLDDPIEAYVPAFAGSGYAGVTIEQALTMSSGVAFDENYDDAFSDVNQLFISLAIGTPLQEILAELGRDRAPGSYNNYISSDSIALGLVLEAATGMPAEDYLATRLWGPMGAERAGFWNTGRIGSVLPFCCFNAALRDYARFGRLYLEGGARNGDQIIPTDWIARSTEPSAPHLEPGDNPASFLTFGYGYHWWIPEEPQGDFLAIGIWGQFIYVAPMRDVVIVKTSADDGFDDRDHETVAMFRAIAQSVSEDFGAD